MVEKRGAEPKCPETRLGEGRRSRPPGLFPAPGSPKAPRRRPDWQPERARSSPRNPGHFLTKTHSPTGRASRGAVSRAQHLSPEPVFRARPGSPLQRRLSERRRPSFPRAGATRRLAEIRKSDSNSKPRGEFQNFSCGCSLGVSTCRKVIFAGPGATNAPRRSQEPGAKEWAVSAIPGRAPANVLSSLATAKPPARRPRGWATCAADVVLETGSAGEGAGKGGRRPLLLDSGKFVSFAVSLLLRGPRRTLPLAGEQRIINYRLFWSSAPTGLLDSVVHPPPIWQTWWGRPLLVWLTEGNDNPLQYSWLENLMHRVGWRATVHGVAKSRTRLSD